MAPISLETLQCSATMTEVMGRTKLQTACKCTNTFYKIHYSTKSREQGYF